MKNQDLFDSELFELEFETSRRRFGDYISIIRASILPMILIFSISLIVTFIYLKNYPTTYRASTTVKIDKPQSNILESPNVFYNISLSERYLQNQIEILKSYYIRDAVAQTLLDSLKTIASISSYQFLVNKVSENEVVPATQSQIRKRLLNAVKIELKKGVDAVNIYCDGLSLHEIQMIVNIYGNVFVEYTKIINREDLTNVKKFLEAEKEKKFNDLNNSEVALEDYQKRIGYVALDDQAKSLVEAISRYDAEKNGYEIEIKGIENNLAKLKEEASKSDPRLYDYVEGQINQPYISELQRQIADIEVKRDIELALTNDSKVIQKISKDADSKLERLKENLNDKTEIVRQGLVAETPEERRLLTQKIFESNLNLGAIRSKLSATKNVMRKYEVDFDNLPSQSIGLAKLERSRRSNEKLYLALEEKYQEATINERSRLGYASLLDPGYDSLGPVAPNRNLIIFTGIIIGLTLGLIFAFVRNYLDKSIKNPEQIENIGASVLSWIPSFKELVEEHSPETDFIVELKPSSTVSEAFKALRTRIQYAKIEAKPSTAILVTSTIPTEGKTIVSVNLAGSFAQAGKKTLLLDCDLRKPRVHNVFKHDRYPGLSDKLFANVTLDDVCRKTKMNNLEYITAGTIPPNPSELLGSIQMKDFLNELKQKYEVVIIDSPPFISVTDSEILFNITDGTLLVARANLTPIDAFLKTYKRLYKINSHNLLGCVLNDFSFKSSYGYYYNYYYYYSKPDMSKPKKRL